MNALLQDLKHQNICTLGMHLSHKNEVSYYVQEMHQRQESTKIQMHGFFPHRGVETDCEEAHVTSN